MPITLNGSTGITAAAFDGTVDAADLTGTLPALNGAALTNLPAPTTAQVGTATAGLTYGAVGTYALLDWGGAGQQGPDATVAGSSLYPANTGAQSSTGFFASVFGRPSGTWRLMGETGYYAGTTALSRADLYTSVFLRIA